jgi:MEMO1 family protein
LELLPRLRTDIQFLPVEMQGRRVLAVRDMLGLREEMIGLVPEIAPVLAFFDGEHTVLDLQEALARSSGNRIVTREEVGQLIADLDDLLILHSDRYLRLKEAARREFAQSSRRPAALAGSAYPEDPGEARAFVEGILQDGDSAAPASSLRALVAPHIDLRVGKAVYQRAYGRLEDRGFERIVVLGTGHGLDDALFSISAKPYESPLGSLPADVQALEKLRRAGDGCLARDDFAHRQEHSIEFQALFLSAVLRREIPIVPILVGGVDEDLLMNRRLTEIPGVTGFLDALREFCGPETLIVAGVDFCHVGPKFGHPRPAPDYEAEFQDHDRRLLAALCRGSAEEFWEEGRRVFGRYNVCGFTAMATLLELLPGATGEVLGYDVWHEEPTRSAVSFAAVALR